MKSLTKGSYVIPLTKKSSSGGISGVHAIASDTATIVETLRAIFEIEILETFLLILTPLLIEIALARPRTVTELRETSWPIVLTTPNREQCELDSQLTWFLQYLPR